MRRVGEWIASAWWGCIVTPVLFAVGISAWGCVVLWHQAKALYRDWREA